MLCEKLNTDWLGERNAKFDKKSSNKKNWMFADFTKAIISTLFSFFFFFFSEKICNFSLVHRKILRETFFLSYFIQGAMDTVQPTLRMEKANEHYYYYINVKIQSCGCQ